MEKLLRFGILVLLIVMALFLPLYSKLTAYDNIANLTPGESIIINGENFTYKEDGTFIPGTCITSIIEWDSNYTVTIELTCNKEEYKVHYNNEDTVYIMQKKSIFPLIEWIL